MDAYIQVDLVKDSGHLYFIKFLDSTDPAISATSRAMAAFVLAAICDNHPKGQTLCASSGLLGVCLSNLPSAATAAEAAMIDVSRREQSVYYYSPETRGMHAWIDGWTDGHVDGEMHGWTYG
eukprot:scaffold219239_cov22-Prasinocladus_malaysianus.AAC.1